MDSILQKYAEDLSKMIQCPTVSNSGAEYFAKFHEVLKEVFPLVHENLEITKVYEGDALLFKWKGKSDKKPVVLMGHQDVVPADDPGWTKPAYGGVIEDGKVWGRGAMDCKNTVYVALRAIEELLKDGFVPEHDIYFASSDNEETSGPGAIELKNWFIKNNIKPEVVIDEGGAIVLELLPGISKPVAAVGVLEKGYGDIKFIARSKGGHSSSPPKNSPVERLSMFAADINRGNYFKKKMSPSAEKMFKALGPVLPSPLNFIMKHIRLFKPVVNKVFPKVHPFGNAILSTTMVFTMTDAADAPNIIPQEAYFIANMRFAPHQPFSKCLPFIEKLMKKYDIEMEVLEARDACPEISTDSWGYKYVVDCIAKTIPDVAIIPYVILGGTDCRHFQEICDCAIRFTPARLSPQQMAAMHANDENIDITALAEGVTFFKHFITNYK